MACDIIKIVDSVVYARIRDVIQIADIKTLETVATKLIENGKKVRLLVIIENFQGWKKAQEWGDVVFMMKHGNDIVKIAIVGDERWKEEAFLFTGKGFRKTEIEFFPPSLLKKAEAWVTL